VVALVRGKALALVLALVLEWEKVFVVPGATSAASERASWVGWSHLVVSDLASPAVALAVNSEDGLLSGRRLPKADL
jgi:hypothetical protein